jgi:hypothetical protein
MAQKVTAMDIRMAATVVFDILSLIVANGSDPGSG